VKILNTLLDNRNEFVKDFVLAIFPASIILSFLLFYFENFEVISNNLLLLVSYKLLSSGFLFWFWITGNKKTSISGWWFVLSIIEVTSFVIIYNYFI
jgi:hypothetical protein